MSSARKKAIVRLLSQELHWGYLPANDLASSDETELLLPDGRALSLQLLAVKHIAYVRDFNLEDTVDPERMGFRSFPSKPRGPGLWVKAYFSDGDAIEGLADTGLPFLDSLLRDQGVFLEPPDKRGNTLRIFIPRTAMTGFEVLGVAGRSEKVRRSSSARPEGQTGLFDLESESP